MLWALYLLFGTHCSLQPPLADMCALIGMSHLLKSECAEVCKWWECDLLPDTLHYQECHYHLIHAVWNCESFRYLHPFWARQRHDYPFPFLVTPSLWEILETMLTVHHAGFHQWLILGRGSLVLGVRKWAYLGRPHLWASMLFFVVIKTVLAFHPCLFI